MEQDWNRAKTHLKQIKECYESIPPQSSWFALSMLNELQRRFDSGERTGELYQEMVKVK